MITFPNAPAAAVLAEPTRTGSRHAYHQSLTYKIFCARKQPGAEVATTFAECLEQIRRVAALTAGMPQIVYLVGWQHEGHDARYPDWSVVNPRLAPGADAATALRELMVEARHCGATVSLHLNMDDAYPSSPLWDEYCARDLLLKNADGRIMDGDVWDGERCHWICKSREWACGLAQRRIDQLCALLPLGEQGTVHIDVFRPNPSPGHGTTWDDEVTACRAIVDHWRSHGVDVTVEYLPDMTLADCHPMILHDQRDEAQRLQLPPERMCGGGAGWSSRWRGMADGEPPWWGLFCSPGAGCRYPEVWGNSLDRDLSLRDPRSMRIADVPAVFAATTLPWQYLNRQHPIEHRHDVAAYEVRFSGGARSRVRIADRHLTIDQDDRRIVDGANRCVPIAWRPRSAIAWHATAANQRWILDPAWGTVDHVAVELLGTAGSEPFAILPSPDGVLDLTLPPQQLALVQPA